MRYVERIGYVAKEAVDGFRLTTLHATACPYCHYEREANDDTESFVESVCTAAFTFCAKRIMRYSCACIASM